MTDAGDAVDAALVARARGGEEAAFELLVVRYQRRVAAWIRALMDDPVVVEELTQEVFLSVFQRLEELREAAAFAGWLRTIARNTALDHLRAQRRRPTAAARSSVDPGHSEQGGPFAEAAVADSFDASQARTLAPSAEAEFEARQLFEAIDRAIEALPARQRQALVMRDLDGLDYRGIAEAMHLPINTVRSLIFRARESVALSIRPLLAPTRDRRW